MLENRLGSYILSYLYGIAFSMRQQKLCIDYERIPCDQEQSEDDQGHRITHSYCTGKAFKPLYNIKDVALAGPRSPPRYSCSRDCPHTAVFALPLHLVSQHATPKTSSTFTNRSELCYKQMGDRMTFSVRLDQSDLTPSVSNSYLGSQLPEKMLRGLWS